MKIDTPCANIPIEVGAGAVLDHFSVSLHLEEPLAVVTAVVVELILRLSV